MNSSQLIEKAQFLRQASIQHFETIYEQKKDKLPLIFAGIGLVGLLFSVLSISTIICLGIVAASLGFHIKKKIQRIRDRGLISYTSGNMKKLLLNRSIFDILCDIWFIPNFSILAKKFLAPLIYKMTPEEAIDLFTDTPELQKTLLTKGIANILPEKVKKIVLPLGVTSTTELEPSHEGKMFKEELEERNHNNDSSTDSSSRKASNDHEIGDLVPASSANTAANTAEKNAERNDEGVFVSPFIAKKRRPHNIDEGFSEDEEEVKSEAEQSEDFFELQRGYKQHDVKILYNTSEQSKVPEDPLNPNSACSDLSALVDIQNDVPMRMNKFNSKLQRKKSEKMESNKAQFSKKKSFKNLPTKVTSLVLNSNINSKKGQSTNVENFEENFRTEVIKKFDKVEYNKEHNLAEFFTWDNMGIYLKYQKDEEAKRNSGYVGPKKVLKIQPPNLKALFRTKVNKVVTNISRNTSYSKICLTSALMLGALYLQIKSSHRIKNWSLSALHLGLFIFTVFGISGTTMAFVVKYLSDKKVRNDKKMIK